MGSVCGFETTSSRGEAKMLVESSTTLYITEGTVLAYDLAANQVDRVKLLPSDPQVSEGHAVATVADGVVVTGGKDNSKGAWIWQHGKFVALPEMSSGHVFHCSAVLGDSLYVISGCNSAVVERYSLATRDWTSAGELAAARSFASAAAHADSLYVIGGKDASNAFLPNFEVYDGTEWTTSTLQLSICAAGVIPKPEGILIFGGQSEEKDPDEIWIADLVHNQIAPTGQTGVIGSFYSHSMVFRHDMGVIYASNGELVRYDVRSSTFLLANDVPERTPEVEEVPQNTEREESEPQEDS